eukprot:comp12063_c0_seq1/m.6776 comp12063_c0_seq1/g.6776  ORF comp12063_c0_seq1/g.6776 comp12063_c0_seq1/m.6776 type:complete len:157 (-) comp12063_c0_seq1:578-1048(-)
MSLGRLSSAFGSTLACRVGGMGALSLGARWYATVKYTKDHEWVSVEGETVTVGITDYAQHTLGDLVYVELPTVGKQLSQSDEMGIVESVKAASDVYAPVSGEVVEVNSGVVDTPGLINQSAEEKGWLVKLKLTNPSEFDALMDKAAYESHCKAAEE